METKKLSDNQIEITKTETVTKVNTYDRKFIEQQILDITKQRDEYIAARQAELDECQTILAEMDKLNIKAKVTEEVV